MHCGTMRWLTEPIVWSKQDVVPDLPRKEELTDFGSLLDVMAEFGRNVENAAMKLDAAPAPLLEELGKKFPGGDFLPRLVSNFAACGARLQEGKCRAVHVQQKIANAQERGKEVWQVLNARDDAWRPKVEADERAEALGKRFGRSFSIDEKRQRLQAKARTTEEFKTHTENACKELDKFLELRWQIAADIVSEICRCYAAVFAGSAQLAADFACTVETLGISSAPSLSISPSASSTGELPVMMATTIGRGQTVQGGPLCPTAETSHQGAGGILGAMAMALSGQSSTSIPPPTVPADAREVSQGFVEGEIVQVWSQSKNEWLNGKVDKVYTASSSVGGYHVPAGVVQVSHAEGMKYVRRDQLASQLRRPGVIGGS